MSDISRRRLIERAATAALAGGLLPGSRGCRARVRLHAQAPADEAAWPNRPVRFIVPLAAGGGLDFVARVVGEHLSRELRQQVFIENRTGAGGTSASTRRSRAAADGYSVLITNDNVASAPHVLRLNIDFLKDLLPVCLLGRQPQALAVHPSLTTVKLGCRPRDAGQAEARHGLRDLGSRLEPARVAGMVRKAGGHQA